ncbi:hypothetical protein BDR03DRAFT_951081 [Suillus americanus]|nr:hypothetical protein BDR03DRAFT_951081 [Suillus americanus]
MIDEASMKTAYAHNRIRQNYWALRRDSPGRHDAGPSLAPGKLPLEPWSLRYFHRRIVMYLLSTWR